MIRFWAEVLFIVAGGMWTGLIIGSVISFLFRRYLQSNKHDLGDALVFPNVRYVAPEPELRAKYWDAVFQLNLSVKLDQSERQLLEYMIVNHHRLSPSEMVIYSWLRRRPNAPSKT